MRSSSPPDTDSPEVRHPVGCLICGGECIGHREERPPLHPNCRSDLIELPGAGGEIVGAAERVVVGPFRVTSLGGPEGWEESFNPEALVPPEVVLEAREEGAEIARELLGRHTLTASMAIYTGGITNISTMMPSLLQEMAQESPRHRQQYARPLIRAERLLSRMLNSEQRATWERADYFDVQSRANPRVTYRIPRWGTIEMSTRSRAGHKMKVKRLCIHPRESLPDGDRVLALKLLTEHQEHELLQTANIMN